MNQGYVRRALTTPEHLLAITGGSSLDPLVVPENGRTPVDPAGIAFGNVSVTIDLTRLLLEQASLAEQLDIQKLEAFGELGATTSITPMLSLISRSVASALGILELTHFRVLVLLSHKDSLVAAELMALMNMGSGPLLKVLDAMEGAGWIEATMRGRGVNQEVTITERGRAVVEKATTQRQIEIDEILQRMSEQDRINVAAAFNSFAVAARERPVNKPPHGMAP